MRLSSKFNFLGIRVKLKDQVRQKILNKKHYRRRHGIYNLRVILQRIFK